VRGTMYHQHVTFLTLAHLERVNEDGYRLIALHNISEPMYIHPGKGNGYGNNEAYACIL